MLLRLTASTPSFLLLFLFLFSAPRSSALHHSSRAPAEGLKIVGEKNEATVAPWRTWIPVLQKGGKANGAGNATLVLAHRRTNRTDVFNHFQRYNGGWNLTDTHYISSVISTAVPFFGVAAAWFLIFGLCLQLICCCYCCCHVEPYGYSKCAYAFSLIFLILFTIVAIVGCFILYTGQGKLHDSTSDTLDYVVSQAELTAQNLENVSDFFDTAKLAGLAVDLSILPPDFGEEIDGIKTKIRNAASVLSNKTADNSQKIHLGIDGMRLALIIVAAVMLFLAFAGFLFSVLGIQFLVYFLVVVGWIVVAVTFLLCGGFLVLHNVIGDTCVAMDEWVLHPTAHTALDEILPCADNATALETLQRSKYVTHQLVNVVDTFLSNVTNGAFPFFSYNQSGPFAPLLCNPFYSNLTDRQCAPGEVTLGNADEVWKNYTCEVSSGNCVTPGRITPVIYTQMASLVHVTYGLYHYGPFLVDLVDCTFVRKTFSDISHKYCPDLRLFTNWIYFGLVVVSVAVMLSLVFWMIYEREQRHRVYTKWRQYMAR